MVYALVSLYFIFYLTDVIDLPDAVLWWVTTLILGVRLVDAVLDILMGAVVDNTRSRWGHLQAVDLRRDARLGRRHHPAVHRSGSA